MKKNVINLRGKQLPSQKKVTKTINIPAATTASGHNVTILDVNSDDIASALGISDDRKKELEHDIITAATRAAGGEKLTLLQVIAIASQHAQSDNELVLATALISEAFGRQDLDGLIDQTKQNLNEGTDDKQPSDESVEASSSDDEDQVPEGFAAFMKMMQGDRADQLAGAEDINDDEQARNQN